MDWIEKILGVAPDGGSGVLELVFVMIPCAAAAAWWALRGHRRTHRA